MYIFCHIYIAGGHTKEMLTLVSCIGSQYTPRYYIMANTDKMSKDKVKQFESTKKKNEEDKVGFLLYCKSSLNQTPFRQFLCGKEKYLY